MKQLLTLSLAVLICSSLSAQTFSQGDGNQDPGQAADQTTPSAALAAWMGSPTVDFDEDAGSNTPFGTTLTAPDILSAATLHIRLRATSTLANTEYLYLNYDGGASGAPFEYAAQLGWLRQQTQGIPTLATGEVVDFILDLSAIPAFTVGGGFYSALGAINCNDAIDISVSGSVNVDFIKIQYTKGGKATFVVGGTYPGAVHLVGANLTPGADIYLLVGFDPTPSEITIAGNLVSVSMIPVMVSFPSQADANGKVVFDLNLSAGVLEADVLLQLVDGGMWIASNLLIL